MSFDDILLGLIVLKARTGYELKKWLDVEGVFIRANSDQAQIYRTLGRLVRAGFAEFRTERRAGPVAKVYHATAAGSRHLAAVLQQPYEPPARWQEADFSARMLFLVLLRPEGVLPMLRRELEHRRAQVTIFRSIPRVFDVDDEWVDAEDALVARLLADLDEAGRRRTDEWIAELEARITAWEPLLEGARPSAIRGAPDSGSQELTVRKPS